MDRFRKLAVHAARLSHEKNAELVCVLDMRVLTIFTEYFVIATVTSPPHMKSLAEYLEETLRTQENIVPIRRDGLPDSTWGILDFGGLVIHLMNPETRNFYDLERIWIEAKRISWRPRTSKKAAVSAR